MTLPHLTSADLHRFTTYEAAGYGDSIRFAEPLPLSSAPVLALPEDPMGLFSPTTHAASQNFCAASTSPVPKPH